MIVPRMGGDYEIEWKTGISFNSVPYPKPQPCITVGTDTDTIMVITRLYGSTTAFVSLKVCYVDTIGDTLVTCLVTAARPVERFLI